MLVERVEFTPSAADASAEELKERMFEDGYLFFPGLLAAQRVLEVRAALLEAIAKQGWLAEGTEPLEALPGKPRTFDDDDWWPGYIAIQRLEAFHALAHSPEVTSVISKLLPPEVMVHPVKIARVTYPSHDFPSLPHQDFIFGRGAVDTVTTWIPLGDVPPELGGLHILPGSHHEGMRKMRPARGAGSVSADIDPNGAGFATTSYAAGDVLIFHSMVVHHAPINRGDRLRLSVDYRYQSTADPVNPAVLFPHRLGDGHVPGWSDLAAGWKEMRWIEVPSPITLCPWMVEPNEVPESRFIKPG